MTWILFICCFLPGNNFEAYLPYKWHCGRRMHFSGLKMMSVPSMMQNSKSVSLNQFRADLVEKKTYHVRTKNNNEPIRSLCFSFQKSYSPTPGKQIKAKSGIHKSVDAIASEGFDCYRQLKWNRH